MCLGALLKLDSQTVRYNEIQEVVAFSNSSRPVTCFQHLTDQKCKNCRDPNVRIPAAPPKKSRYIYIYI